MSFFIAVTIMLNLPNKPSPLQRLPDIYQEPEKSKQVFIWHGGLNFLTVDKFENETET
jgi:hypothetical protein